MSQDMIIGTGPKAKQIFYDALFTKFKNDIRGMWKTINDI